MRNPGCSPVFRQTANAPAFRYELFSNGDPLKCEGTSFLLQFGKVVTAFCLGDDQLMSAGFDLSAQHPVVQIDRCCAPAESTNQEVDSI